VHGACRDALRHAADTVSVELNAVTDNPILVDGRVISGGNFHGEPLAFVLDYLCIALTEWASISERRVYLLLSGPDGLPTLLMKDTGLNSGFMIPQYTAAALVNECKVLSTPASVDSIPTSLGQEDHVSMGATSALKCWEVLDRAETALAVELVCAAQALDYRLPIRPGVGPRRALETVRRHIPHSEQDHLLGDDLHTGLELFRSGEIQSAVEAETGVLQ
jgi:histidine ammonia-lyase